MGSRGSRWAVLIALAVGACDEHATRPRNVPHAEVSFRIPLITRGESSPTLCDLDGDGDLEVLVGRQPVESAVEDSIVTAFDATSGAWLWTGPAETFAYGSVGCLPTGAGDDVLVSGRSGEVIRDDGRSGAEVWRLTALNPVTLPAASVDGFVSTPIVDRATGTCATTFGGDALNSVPARFVVFDASGAVLAVRESPIGVESYASPALARDASGAMIFAFATGGESRGGTIELLRFEPSYGITLVGTAPSNCNSGGYVASPLFADVDDDGARELVGADYCGHVVVAELDGSVRFAVQVDPGFATANPVAADVDGDGTLDVVAAFSDYNPTYPPNGSNAASRVYALSGVDGRSLWTRDVPGYVIASPSVAEIDGDGREDVLLASVSFPASLTPSVIVGGLRWISGRDGADRWSSSGIGSASTPVLDDVDGDSRLDLFVVDVPSANNRSASLLRFAIEGATWQRRGTFSGFRGHPDGVGAR